MEILKLIIWATSITGLLAFLSRQYIIYSFNSSLEKYKAELNKESLQYQSELNRQSEAYKAELEKSSYEHQTRYTKLHEERAEVVKILFQKLVDLEDCTRNDIANGNFIKSDTVEKVKQSFNNYRNYFLLNEIFLEEHIIKLVNALDRVFMDAWFNINESRDPIYDQKEKFKLRQAARDKILVEIPKLKGELKIRLQDIIGLKNS